MIKMILICVLFFCFPVLIKAQDNHWFNFMGEFDGTPGEVYVNLLLKNKATISSQSFLIMTAMKMNKPSVHGLSSPEELPTLLKFADDVENTLKKKGQYSYAGNFTHEGVRINYFYVEDTIGLRQEFTIMYAEQYPNYNLGLNIKEEKNWQTYFEFLYPGEKAIEQIKERRRKNGD